MEEMHRARYWTRGMQLPLPLLVYHPLSITTCSAVLLGGLLRLHCVSMVEHIIGYWWSQPSILSLPLRLGSEAENSDTVDL
jgi:hypothetical protein